MDADERRPGAFTGGDHEAWDAEPDEDPQDAYLPDVDDLVERGYMMDFGRGYPEWC